MNPRFLCAFLLLVGWPVSGSAREEAWRGRLTPTVGPFPLVKPFRGEFRFGWSNIPAATAHAIFTQKGTSLRMHVWGGTSGAVRWLWKLDATHETSISADRLLTDWFFQVERYADRTVYTQAVYQKDGLWRQRNVVPDPKGPAKWKHIKVGPSRGLVATMLFIRSQPLRTGDKVSCIAFPGDDSYLVDVKVEGRENLKVAGKSRPAIKLSFQIQKVVRDKKTKISHLEPHRKFRNGRVWISDDPTRMALRVEVNIFIGYVYGELVNLRML